MNLNDFASELAAKNHFIKASFGGFQGSGNYRKFLLMERNCDKYLS